MTNRLCISSRRRHSLRRRPQSTEEGFFTIWVLGLCAMVFGLGGLSYDLWSAFSDRREVAAIVDGAAVAASSQIDLATFRANSTVVLDTAAARSAAAAYLARAEQESDIDLFDETIDFAGNDVVITASTTTELTLSRIFVQGGDFTVTVVGVANPEVAR